jgi:hypothetical protein
VFKEERVRLVYYSLAHVPDDSREHQWIQSIRSLRRYHGSIPVWLFLFNEASNELLWEAERRDVHVQRLGDYSEYLQRSHTRGSVLAQYPTFHKFLVLTHLPLQSLTQVLYLDCDTFFFDDVNRLFDRYSADEWYAREEPSSHRSQYPYNPLHVDEELLEHIAHGEGLRYVPPFNSGVCLLNRGIWNRLDDLRIPYLDLAWRLLCGQQLSGDPEEPQDPQVREAVVNASGELDRSRALPYPSANHWIIEQIALWLALGGLRSFSRGTLSSEQVPQGGEFETALRSNRECVLAHYYSGGEQDFFKSVPAIAA